MNHVADREYWERRLAGRDFVCAAFPDLPPFTPAAPDERAALEFRLRPETADRLLALANGSDHALFTLLLAGLRQLLFRYSGQRALALGTPAFAAEFDPQIRNRLVVLTGEVCRGQSFKDMLLLERETVLRAKQHQNFPIARVLAALNTAVSPDCFGVFLGLKNIQHPDFAQSERPAIAFAFERDGSEIRGTATYARARYEEGYIAQIAQHLETLLLAGCANPSAAFDDRGLLSPAETDRLLREFSRRRVAIAEPSTIVAEFEAQAALAPDRVALSCEAQTLTYGELNLRANRLARRLRASGVGPEEPVALYLTRSIEAIVGMLGILKAGAAYLPLDPSYPPVRNRFMIEDAGVRTILATGKPPEPDRLGAARWIRLQADDEPADRSAGANFPSGAGAKSIAYVLYTSGTTGIPKGVQIPHRGVVQLVKDSGFVRLKSGEVFLAQASLTFDAFTLEIWGALLNGAHLVISAKLQPTLAELAHAIRGGPVNCILQTAALFHLMVDEQPSALRSVRQLMVGGDVLSVRHARNFLPGFSGRLWNIYGPTENSVVSTAHLVTAANLHRASIPIGRPIGDTEVYILDDALRPVPVGLTGEIYLGGAGLARGYLNRRALTAERFLPHPFSATPGARLYRSGDLGRFLPDGTVEFGGRVDGQVKIRGFRVELGEIEALVGKHPAVKAATVVVQTDPSGTKRLVAFVVARERRELSGRELQEFIRQRAPEHEIPASFVFRDELPLNQSGKIDRSHLLRLLETATSPASRKEPARTAAERAMAAIWHDVLHREDIGVNEDFFEIGGDSLLAMQLLARINKSGLHLPARQFFRTPTIAACALAAKPRAAAATGETLPQGVVPLTPVQRWFFETHPDDPHYFNLSALFDVKDALDPTTVARAAGHLVRHHDALLLTFSRDVTGWTARYMSPPRDDALLTTVDLSAFAADARTRELKNKTQFFQEALNLAEGPPIRFVYFYCGSGGRDRLLVVVHHLVIDAVSWRIVVDDLETALGQLHAGQDVHLPSPTDSFGAWASQLPAYLESEAAQAGRAYWLQAPPVFAAGNFSALPAGTPRAARELIIHTFTTEETKALLRFVPVAKATMEELLLAALLLHHCAACGTSGLGVTLDRHGRSESIGDLDVSRTIGWFTAFFPVYLTLGGDSSFEAALGIVTKTVRRIPNRGVDYGLLRHLGQPQERDRLAAFPQPEVSLNYQGEFDHELGRSSYFTLSADSFGAQQSVRHQALHALEIDASIVEGKMNLLCACATRRYPRDHAARLVAAVAATLGRQAARARTGPSGDSSASSGPATPIADLTHS